LLYVSQPPPNSRKAHACTAERNESGNRDRGFANRAGQIIRHGNRSISLKGQLTKPLLV
jgi:hypothetical protein